MTGQQGWKKGALGYYGTEQALDLMGSAFPQTLDLERVQEDTSPTNVIPAEDLGPPNYPEESFLDREPDQKKQPETIITNPKSDNTIEQSENEMKDEALASNDSTITTNNAQVSATNSTAAASIDNDSVSRVKAYKEVAKQFLGQGDEGMRMQKGALLMSIGGALLAGKSDDPGLRGFVDIVGKTAMQTAPMLFQMGVEQGKADREIGQAALQLYMEEQDKLNDRTGDFVAVFANEYKRTADGGVEYGLDGAPITTGRRLVGQYRANSPEMNFFLDQNNLLGYPGYTFQTSQGTAAGLSGITTPGDDSSIMLTDAGKDSMLRSARYINGALTTMANNILPLMIENRDLIGVKGFINRKFGPSAYFLSEVANGFKAAWGANSIQQLTDDEFVVNRNSELGKYYESLLPGSDSGNKMDNSTGGMTYGVLENATQGEFIEIDGQMMPVYVDTAGKYGVKGGRYLTRGALEKLLFDPRRGQLAMFETTLGLALARNRQPTGRMLADVLKRSFEETKTTDLFGKANMPQVVIGNYVKIYNELYQGMSSQLHAAGYIPNEESRVNSSQQISSMYNIQGSNQMANIYYDLRKSDPSYSTYSFDIQGPSIPSFSAYMGGNTAVVNADSTQTTNSVVDTFNYFNDLLDQ